MTDNKSHNPLYGLKMEQLLSEISDHYGWALLSEALHIDRFQYHTGMKSTVKFLRNNQWAKEKVESFYLYQYKGFSYPDEKQLAIAPRDRFISAEQQAGEPSAITEEVITQIDRISQLRSYKNLTNRKVKKEAVRRSAEPPYDPSNPWNK